MSPFRSSLQVIFLCPCLVLAQPAVQRGSVEDARSNARVQREAFDAAFLRATVQGEITAIDWKKRQITVRQPRGSEALCLFDLHTKVFIDGQTTKPWRLMIGHVVAFSYGFDPKSLEPAKNSPVGQINAFVETDPRPLPGKPALTAKVPPKPTVEEAEQAAEAEREADKEIAQEAKKTRKPEKRKAANQPKEDPKPTSPADPKAEASRRLRFAKQYLREAANQNNKEGERLKELATKHLQEIVDKFSDTPSAPEARKLLEDLK